MGFYIEDRTRAVLYVTFLIGFEQNCENQQNNYKKKKTKNNSKKKKKKHVN